VAWFGNHIFRGKIIHFNFFGGEYNLPEILLKNFRLKRDKKGHKLFFTGALPPKMPCRNYATVVT
jgi:hypothetical protein